LTRASSHARSASVIFIEAGRHSLTMLIVITRFAALVANHSAAGQRAAIRNATK